MDRGVIWLDTGTINTMEAGSEFIRVIEKRSNIKIACLEEIAYLHGYINKKQLLKAADKYGNSSYGQYIKSLLKFNE